MNNYYAFHYVFPELGLCRDGEETIVKPDCHAFLLDDKVNGIKVRMRVSRNEIERTETTVRKRLVLYKDDDCKEFFDVFLKYLNWKRGNSRSKGMSMDAKSIKNIEAMYRKG